MNYTEIKNSTAYKQDRNCCTVVASSIAFDIPFDQMLEVFKIAIGRRKNSGTVFGAWVNKLAKTYNYKLEIFYICKDGKEWSWWKKNKEITSLNNRIKKVTNSSLTVATAEKVLTEGNYILGCRGHVLALKNGIVEDWSRGSKRRIETIYKLTKLKRKKTKTKSQSKYDWSKY